jgi:hypothetical protein
LGWAGTEHWKTLNCNTGAMSTVPRLYCLDIIKIVTGLELDVGNNLHSNTGTKSTDFRLLCLEKTMNKYYFKRM